MRMFCASLIGVAGLASLLVFCPPLRAQAQLVLLGEDGAVISKAPPAESVPARPEAGSEPRGDAAT